jgi:hypothetical protein
MVVPPVTLTARRGDTTELPVHVVDEAGAPTSVAGSVFWFTVKRNIDDPDSEALFQKQLGSGITVIDAPTGQLLVSIAAADWAAYLDIDPLRMVWDLQERLPSSKVTTLAGGPFVVERDVTRVS